MYLSTILLYSIILVAENKGCFYLKSIMGWDIRT